MPTKPRARPRQIVAIGGGGLYLGRGGFRLERYILGLTGKRRPRVAFVATASAEEPGYVAQFFRTMGRLDCRPSEISLFRITGASPAERLLEQDVIYVGGGNTANLLAVWRVHGVDRAMREAWRRGIVLCGTSAGMNCWFEGSVTDSFGGLRGLNDGLSILPGSACPHYDGEPGRRPTYRRLVADGDLPGGLAAEDGSAVHFVGRRIHRCVTALPNSAVYRVARAGRRAVETALPTALLDRDGGIARGPASA
jgi:peptidase E